MRILFVSEVYPDPLKPQYGVFIKQQADALSALGNTVDVLVPVRGSDKTSVDPVVYDSKTVYSVGYKTLRYELFPLLAAKATYRAVERLISDNRYDLVAVHITGDSLLKIIVKICKKRKIKVVAHYHGLNVWEEYTTVHPFRQQLYAARRRRILAHTDGLVGVSEKVCEIIRGRLETVPVCTVYNGVDVALFSKKKPTDRLCHIIGVGNLIEIKGFRYLLEAFSRLIKDFPHIKLDIVGDGVCRQQLEKQAKELGISESVVFHGRIPYEQVATNLQESDIFVLPSFYEALGCVYLEAMACGLPTIGVKGMGIDEIITDGENGMLVNPKDSEDLYKKMYSLVGDGHLAEEMGKKARITAQRYTWLASAETLNNFYKECINNEYSVFNR